MPKSKADSAWSKKDKKDFQHGMGQTPDEAMASAKRNLAALFMKNQAEQKEAQVSNPDPTQDSINSAFRSRAGAPTVSGYSDMQDAPQPKPRFGQIRQALAPKPEMPASQSLANDLNQQDALTQARADQMSDEDMKKKLEMLRNR